jgi:hypothetical protein
MWTILNTPIKTNCFRIVLNTAHIRARKNPKEPPLVQFHGVKPAVIVDLKQADFYVLADGTYLPIDPNWHGNLKK